MENGFIVGYGVVGKATADALKITKSYDIARQKNDFVHEFVDRYRFDRYYFICVPTPNQGEDQDLSMVHLAIKHVLDNDKEPIFVIRSTIKPGTTHALQLHYSRPFIHFPEFLTEATAFEDESNPELLMIGCEDVKIRYEFMRILGEILGKTPQVYPRTETTELIKYAMNTFFGMKVVLGNIFWDIASEVGADYWAIQDALEKHKWGSRNGWNPFHGGFRGFGGKCLPKDIEAISKFDKTGFIKHLLEANNGYKV